VVKYATRLHDEAHGIAYMETLVAPVLERPERARPRRAHRVDPAHVRAEISHGLGPAEVLTRLNAAMLRRIGDSPGRFATVAHGQLTLTPTGATVRLANAGHPPPLLLRHGNVVPVEAPGTLPGVYPDVAVTEVSCTLHRNEILVLYTDGVTEARGTDGFYGPDRLEKVLRAANGGAEAVADRLLADLDAFHSGVHRDDIAILVVEATP
jgi:sigma-B regulation protein RsbU (phosphoserine phosphatase)